MRKRPAMFGPLFEPAWLRSIHVYKVGLKSRRYRHRRSGVAGQEAGGETDRTRMRAALQKRIGAKRSQETLLNFVGQ